MVNLSKPVNLGTLKYRIGCVFGGVFYFVAGEICSLIEMLWGLDLVLVIDNDARVNPSIEPCGTVCQCCRALWARVLGYSNSMQPLLAATPRELVSGCAGSECRASLNPVVGYKRLMRILATIRAACFSEGA